MQTYKPKGDFIVFEGINGCGKSTVMQAAAERLRSKLGDDKVITLTNPSTGPIGMEARRFMAAQREIGFPSFFTRGERDETLVFATRMALLMVADRQLLQATITAAVDAGKTVLCDRYSLSTLMYQCAMVGDVTLQTNFASWIIRAHEGVRTPDTTIVVDASLHVARARLASRGEHVDDLMMATIEPAVRAMYLDYARGGGDSEIRSLVGMSTEIINGDKPLNVVVGEAMEAISGLPF